MALDNFKKTSMRIDKANQRFLDYQNAKVGDINGRELLVQITNNGVVEDQTGTTLKLNWQHENGNQGSTSFSAVDIKQGKYSLYYPKEMLYKGSVDASIEIISNGQTTNTMNFKIIVHADVFNGEAGTVNGVFISLADVNKKLDDREKEYTELKSRQTSLETQFDNVQQDLTDKDVISAPEIIAARNGEADLKTRLDKEQQEVNTQLAQTEKGINRGVATNSISNGGGFQRKPIVSFTFDDGYLNDYTLMKPVMDEFCVKGTLYINTDYTGYNSPKLTETEIKELASEGWEFGSHTNSHTILSELAISENISMGDNEIHVINTSNIPMFKAFPQGTKFRLRNSEGTQFETITATSYSLNGKILTLMLDRPTNFELATPAVIYLHEESVLEEVTTPKKYLQSIGVPCNGFAYPWGNATESARKVVQSQFNYARNATNGTAGTNGGVYDGDELQLKQFALNCSELPTLTDSAMDALIAEVISENGLLIVLGHTNGWSALEPKLRTFIDKVQSAGVDIMPLNEALLYHGNTADLGDFSVSKNGTTMSGGVNMLPRKFATATSNLDIFPLGISTMRVHSVDNAGFPTNAGTLVTYKTKKKGIGYWTWQYFYDQNSNDIYYRNSTGATSYRPWEKQSRYTKYPQITTASITVNANSYVDVELSGVVVNNLSVLAVSAYVMPLNKNVLYTTYIQSARAYLRVTNLDSAPLTTTHRVSVAVLD